MTQPGFRRLYPILAVAAATVAGCGGVFGDEEEATTAEVSPEDAENVAVEMRPASAEIVDFDPDDDEREFVRLTFTREIQDFDEDGEGLFVQGFDPEELEEAETVELVEDDTRSLLLGFEEGTNLPSFTLAAAEDGIVEDAEGNENVQDAVPLAGGATVSGPTAAPELVGFQVEQARNRIDFEFDERLDESGGDVSDFGFYTPEGDVHTGDDLVSIEDRVAVVEFDEDDGDQVEDAERLFARDGAVQGRQGSENVSGAVGGATAAPDLRAVEPVEGSDTQWDFAFDEPVEVEDEERFVVVRREGDRDAADSAENLNEQTIRASFEDVEDVSEQVVLAVAEEGAVEGVDEQETENTLGVARLEGEEGGGIAGGTSGPDLVDARVVDPSAGRVGFIFDEPVEEDDDLSEEDFFMITQAGEVASGDEIVEVGDEDERFVIVSFEESELGAAQGFSVDAGAVEDEEGEPNPVGTVAGRTQ